MTEQIQLSRSTLPQAGAHGAAMAELVVDPRFDDDVVQRLVAERPRPPQLRLVDRHRPLDVVLARRERLLQLVVDGADR